MIQTVIFDMDGVLIDSQPLHYQLDVNVLQKCGINATIDTATPYTGMSNPDRWPNYKAQFNLPHTVAELIAMAEAEMEAIFNHTPLVPTPGAVDFLADLKALGIHCGIASSSSHELIRLVLDKTGVGGYFSTITSGEDVTHSKPHPEIYLTAAKKAKTPPENCLAIEDAPYGILAAKNAGIPCIGYTNPSTIGQDFTHATFVVTHFNQCLNIVKGGK